MKFGFSKLAVAPVQKFSGEELVKLLLYKTVRKVQF
jgi:hypothetical protein